MFGTSGKTAWRLLAAVPFVLLLGIVGIKVAAGDPTSPFNKIPGAATIQELGGDAPSTNVTVQLPKTPKPAPSTSAASASASASLAALPTPMPTAGKPAPTKQATAAAGGGTDAGVGSTPGTKPSASQQSDPTPSPTPLTAQQQCEANGGHWRQGLFGGWSCSLI
jgi:hypothetical protein